MPGMADYTVVGAVAETLRALLQDHITDTDLADLTGVPVDLRSPHELADANVTRAVSVWLYRLAIQPDLLNLPPAPTPDGLVAHQPLPLDLHFLVTAIHGDAKTQLALTGRVLQVVNDHGRLRGSQLRDVLAGTDTELRVSIEATSMTETSDLWYSLQAPFRLAVPVVMQVAWVGSHLPPVAQTRVLTRRTRVGQPVGGMP
jgi:hypothetical protein